MTLCNELLTLCFHDVVRKHNGLYPREIDCHLEKIDRVERDSDVTDLACGFCLKERFKRAAGCHYSFKITGAGVMYLIEVYVVRAKIFKACIDILCHCIFSARHALCGKHKAVSDALKRKSEIFLTHSISARCINKINTLFYQR